MGSGGKYRYNRYNDVEIDVGRMDIGSEESFSRDLEREIRRWKSRISGRRGETSALMWLRVPVDNVHCVPWVVRRRFSLHHATPDYVMLVHRASSRAVVPKYGTHYMRVECLVVEAGTGRVLVVKESVGPSDLKYKFVTGSVDPGEYVSEAAVREVREETGIRATVSGMLGLGNRLGTRFGKDEMLVGVLMTAEIGQVPTRDDMEVEDARWMDPSEAVSRCTQMALEWLIVSRLPRAQRGSFPDFRGPPHKMEVYLQRQ